MLEYVVCMWSAGWIADMAYPTSFAGACVTFLFAYPLMAWVIYYVKNDGGISW